jgi:hypothetical protein
MFALKLIAVFHTLHSSVASSEKYQSQEVVSNKIEKGLLRDNATDFCTYGSGENFKEFAVSKFLALV